VKNVENEEKNYWKFNILKELPSKKLLQLSIDFSTTAIIIVVNIK